MTLRPVMIMRMTRRLSQVLRRTIRLRMPHHQRSLRRKQSKVPPRKRTLPQPLMTLRPRRLLAMDQLLLVRMSPTPNHRQVKMKPKISKLNPQTPMLKPKRALQQRRVRQKSLQKKLRLLFPNKQRRTPRRRTRRRRKQEDLRYKRRLLQLLKTAQLSRLHWKSRQ